ncbi:MAG: hypothetical protein NTU54_02095 [Candidatus Omnitrophica bacterium]|nr:hypothetical protein [Candidatus Omnitrophota bacterium]
MFNEEIEKSSVSLRNVGIIEERYMNGDRCVRLGYFLKVLDRHNLVSLSAGGIYPSMTKDEFLRSAQDLQFLIAFSQSAAGPDLAGLMDFSEGGQRDKAAKAVALFRGFKIVRSALLFPEGLRVFLLKREQ